MRLSTLVCSAFLVLGTALSAFAAPKSAQVERYLGNYRFENAKPVGVVKFIFEKAILKRKGDGRSTYKELLFSEPLFSNEDNAGRLIGVQLLYRGRTETVLPESPDRPGADAEVSQPQAQPQQPQSREEAARPNVNIGNNPRARTGGGLMPDSATLVTKLEGAKGTITDFKATMLKNSRPVWSFVMWIFNSVIIFLICLGGLFRYIAQTAASESAVNIYGRIVVGRWIAAIHQNAAAMLLVITWMIAIVLLIDVFLWLIFLNFPLWLMLVIWFPILWIAEKFTNWIVPNIKVVGPGR
jgi:hypothetical protein